MSTPGTLDLNGASALMNIHPRTLRDLIDQGAVPAAKIGRAYVFMYKDIIGYIENAVIQQTAARMRRPITTSSRPKTSP